MLKGMQGKKHGVKFPVLSALTGKVAKHAKSRSVITLNLANMDSGQSLPKVLSVRWFCQDKRLVALLPLVGEWGIISHRALGRMSVFLLLTMLCAAFYVVHTTYIKLHLWCIYKLHYSNHVSPCNVSLPCTLNLEKSGRVWK